MKIDEFKAVILNYQVKDETGEIIDSSDVDGPISCNSWIRVAAASPFETPQLTTLCRFNTD